jgi:hypothetical protein
MAKSSKLRVMISSRCDDKFPAHPGRPLSEIRKKLKMEIEALEVVRGTCCVLTRSRDNTAHSAALAKVLLNS